MAAAIEIRKYYPYDNVDFQGNPLIEMMPQLSRKIIGKMLANPVHCSNEERSHSSEQRIGYVSRLLRYFVPLQDQLDFAEDLWATILEGYRRRHPLKPITTESFNDFCESVHSGTFTASDDDNFLESSVAITLVGTPGTGKTTTVQRLLKHLPGSLVHHVRHRDLYQLIYLRIEAPDTEGYLALLKNLYEELLKVALEIGVPIPRLSARVTRGDLENQIAVLAKKLNLGLLILDELQHLAGGRNVDEKTMIFLTGFVNRVGIPVLLIGTWPALSVLGSELRIMRRTITRASRLSKKMKNDEVWMSFLSGLFRLQWTRHVVKHTDGNLAERFYYHTQGIHDLAVKLMFLAQIEAIRSGLDTLTGELIDQVAEEHFPTIAPAVRQMRADRQETDPLLWDSEPKHVDEYLAAVAARAIETSIDSPRAKFAAAAMIKKRDGERKAQPGRPLDSFPVQSAARDHAMPEPHSSKAATRNSSAVKRPTSFRPGRSDTKRVEVKERFASLSDSDLRRVVFEGLERGESAPVCLDNAGHMFVGLSGGFQ